MGVYQGVVAPLLFRFDPERTHEATLRALTLAQNNPAGRRLLRALAGDLPASPVNLFGLRFPNPIGVAAGFDKDARVVPGLAALGFGHIEVGTLTPRPQAGNPRPRIFRLPQDGALINRMGFPNAGVAAAVDHLRALGSARGDAMVGVSLGKQKETPLADALADYLAVMRAVFPVADYLAVNVSSPNTPGLRELQGGDYLAHLLAGIRAENERLATQHSLSVRPWLVKIAPDLDWPELDALLAAAETAGASGVIATNTTLSRAGVRGSARAETGGLSGAPLRARSQEMVAYIHRHGGGRLPIVGVGGVRRPADALQLLDAGASLVQVYTGLVYEGPGLAGRIVRALAKAGYRPEPPPSPTPAPPGAGELPTVG